MVCQPSNLQKIYIIVIVMKNAFKNKILKEWIFFPPKENRVGLYAYHFFSVSPSKASAIATGKKIISGVNSVCLLSLAKWEHLEVLILLLFSNAAVTRKGLMRIK